MRVAVVSKDGKNVDEHFGKAKSFLIYDIDKSRYSFMENRLTESLSEENPKHTFNSERFKKVYEIIRDCKVVICTQIGNRPGKELKDAGVETMLYLGTIDDALKKAEHFKVALN